MTRPDASRAAAAVDPPTAGAAGPETATIAELLDRYAADVYGSADDSYPTPDHEVAASRAAVERYVATLEARLRDAERREAAWAEVDAAQQVMLAAYRTGNHRRVDAALTKLDAARLDLARAAPRGDAMRMP